MDDKRIHILWQETDQHELYKSHEKYQKDNDPCNAQGLPIQNSESSIKTLKLT